MKIIHLATSLDGGAGIGLWRYHQALIAVGVDSRILVMNPPSDLDREVGKVHWKKHPLPLRMAQRLGLFQPRSDRIKKQIAVIDRSAGRADYELFTVPFSDYCPEDHPWIAEADLVNIHWVAGLLDWPRFFSRVSKPIVITLHDQQPYLGGFHYAQDSANNTHLSALDATLCTVKKNALREHRVGVVANSQWNSIEARASGFFAPGTPIETIYYPIDTAIFAPRPQVAAKTAAGIASHRKVIGFACENLNNRRKGFADLIAALDLMPESLRTQITLLSFGRDPAPDLLARVSLPWVHLGFLRTDEAKVSAYAAMDVFVAPSHAEAFGLTALEAEAVGVPVVATRVGGLAEAVPASVAPDAPSICAGIVEMLTDDSVRTTRVAAGRRIATERHAPQLIGAQLSAFFRQLSA